MSVSATSFQSSPICLSEPSTPNVPIPTSSSSDPLTAAQGNPFYKSVSRSSSLDLPIYPSEPLKRVEEKPFRWQTLQNDIQVNIAANAVFTLITEHPNNLSKIGEVFKSVTNNMSSDQLQIFCHVFFGILNVRLGLFSRGINKPAEKSNVWFVIWNDFHLFSQSVNPQIGQAVLKRMNLLKDMNKRIFNHPTPIGLDPKISCSASEKMVLLQKLYNGCFNKV